jgi:hypothetical protein
MRWVLMLFVVLAAVMGGEARIDCSAGPGGAWPIGGNGLGERVLTAEAEMRLEPGAGQLAAGEVLVAWRGESVVELANLPEAARRHGISNLENEHVYRVGPAGILVHNTCLTPKELFEGGGGVKTKATTGAETVNHGAALRYKLSALEDARAGAASTRTLPDGQVRYYGPETPARTPGPTRGASYVTEHSPATGGVRSWMESYDQARNLNQVHPKVINGQASEFSALFTNS